MSPSAAREQVLTLKEGDEANPRMDALDWSPDGQALYLTWSERDRWERGLVRMDVATKALVPLVKDARLYSGFRQTRDGRLLRVHACRTATVRATFRPRRRTSRAQDA